MASISTSGWDVVSVTDIDTMNKVINSRVKNYLLEEKEIFPSAFESTVKLLQDELKISGQWNKWEISNEASGKNVYLRCSVKNGTVEFRGEQYQMNVQMVLPMIRKNGLVRIKHQILLIGLNVSN